MSIAWAVGRRCPQRAGVRRYAFWRVLPVLARRAEDSAPYLRPWRFKNSVKMHPSVPQDALGYGDNWDEWVPVERLRAAIPPLN